MSTKALKSAGASFIATMVLSGTGIAIADDSDVSAMVESSSVVAEDTHTNGSTSNDGEVVESDFDITDNLQTADDVTPEPLIVVNNECSHFESDEGFLVQRCVGVDAAKSSVSTSDRQVKAAVDQSAVLPVSVPVQSQRASAVRASDVQPPAPLSVDDVAVKNTDVLAQSTEIEKPTLPITGTDKAIDAKESGRGVTAGAHGIDNATLFIDNPFIEASARASIFAMVACAVFALVGAGALANVRRLTH